MVISYIYPMTCWRMKLMHVESLNIFDVEMVVLK
jgi:hypothetical protein